MAITTNDFHRELAKTINEPPKLEFIQGNHTFAKTTLLAIAAISSASAKIPYISIAMEAEPIGIGVAICDMSMWFVAEMNWAMAIVEDIFKQNPFEEKSSLCKGALTGATALLLALISQLPAVAPAAKYNKAWKYEAGATVAISGAILATRGLQQSIQGVSQCCQKTEMRWQDMIALREKMGEVLSDHLIAYQKADRAEMQAIADKFAKLKDGTDQQLIKEFWELIKPKVPDEKGSINAPTIETPLLVTPRINTSTTMRWIGEKIAQFLGACCTLFFELCVGYYTYKWTEDETDSRATALTLSALSMAGYAYMMGAGVAAIATGVFGGLFDRCTGNHQPTLAEKLAPKRMKMLKSTAIVMGAFATATTWIIWRDFFNEKDVWRWKGRKIVQRTAMVNNVIAIGSLLYSSILPAVDRQVENWLLHHDPKGDGKLVAHPRMVERVIALVEMMPPELLQTVVEHPSNEVYADMLKEVRSASSQREMMNYVA